MGGGSRPPASRSIFVTIHVVNPLMTKLQSCLGAKLVGADYFHAHIVLTVEIRYDVRLNTSKPPYYQNE